MRDGRVRARDLVERCLERIEQWQPVTNAFTFVDPAAARRDADAADAALRAGHDRGVLHGIPVSLKDLLDQKGCVTTAGSRSMTAVATEDAPAVAHLRAHGPVLLGRTNMHEFAMGTTSEDSGFGAVRHPRDAAHSAGGSSGGAAVAVATGMSHAAIGSDTGGSIRIPSAACGLVGLKPAWGDVSLTGVVPLSPTLDCVGPLATSVEDAWLMLQAIRSRAIPACPPARDVRGLAIGVLRTFGWQAVDAGIGARVDAALDALHAAGAPRTDMSMAIAPLVASAYGTIVIREALDFHAPRLDEHGAAYTPAVRHRLSTADRPSDEAYAEALDVRRRVEEEVSALLTRVDVLALPGMAITPPRLGQAHVAWSDSDNEPTRLAMLRLTQPFNMSRHPAVVLPVGATPDGWPASLQLVGRDTASLVAAARGVEALLTQDRA